MRKKMTFAELSRQNTGIAMMDSGGATGRHWQRPLPQNDPYFELNKFERQNGEVTYEVSTYIPLHTFLEAHLEIDHAMTAKLRKLEAKAGESFSVMSAAEALAENLGWKVAQDGDNSYNYDNDLTQDFQYSVITTQDAGLEWYYADTENSIILIETHNGADVRGGYSDVVACRSTGTEAGLFDFTCGVRILEGTNPDGSEMTEDQMRKLDDKWEVGYSSAPSYHFGEQVEKIVGRFKKYSHTDKVKVRLKSGHVVTVYPSARLDY
jgi:hypothetical protein